MITAIVLVHVESDRIPEVAEAIADQLSKVDGVRATETHIAFRTYSKHDLDAAFSLGAETAD